MQNKTTIYLLPLTGILIKDIKKWLINAYLGNDKFQNLNDRNYIFIELRENIKKENVSLLINIENTSNFITKYKLEKSIIYVMELLPEFKDEFNMFIIGMFTKFSNNAKTLILYNLEGTTKMIYESILNPTNDTYNMMVDHYCVDCTCKGGDIQRSNVVHKDKLKKVLLTHGQIVSKPNIKNETLCTEIEYEFKSGVNQL